MENQSLTKRAGLKGDMDFGQRAAGVLARTVGSWKMLIGQAIFIIAWMLTGGFGHDPTPWLILNIMLSLQASITGPVLQLSSNRQEHLDRTRDDIEAAEVQDLLQLQQVQLDILREVRGLQVEMHALQQAMARSGPDDHAPA